MVALLRSAQKTLRKQMNSLSDPQTIVRMFLARNEMMCSIAKRYVPAPDLVQDVLQQVFIDFLHAVDKNDWTESTDLNPILNRMTRNRAVELWRKRRKEFSVDFQDIADTLLDAYVEPFGENDSGESNMSKRLNVLRNCVRSLPIKSRELLEEHYGKGVSIKQVAEKRNAKPNSVRQIFSRLRVKLKQCIRKNLSDFSDD